MVRIALANLRFPRDREESLALAVEGVKRASRVGAAVVCFPECFVPGYRGVGKRVEAADAGWLEGAWRRVGEAAREGEVAVVLGTERVVGGGGMASAVVFDERGDVEGFQDNVQIDPSEEGTYRPGVGRRLFGAGGDTFGVLICHEGWRYPETVRWAARRGARVVFHLQFHEAEEGSYRPREFADPANTFHEKAILCRGAENTCFVASVNYAGEGSPTTSVVAGPDGRVVCWQPYGVEGLLTADLDLGEATGLLARRLREADPGG